MSELKHRPPLKNIYEMSSFEIGLPSPLQNGRLAPNPLSAKINPLGGRLAQMGERLVRNEEAGGSNPLPSTKNYPTLRAAICDPTFYD